MRAAKQERKLYPEKRSSRINNKAEMLHTSRARRRYQRAAVKLSALFNEVSSMIGVDCNPQSCSIYIQGATDIADEAFGHVCCDYIGNRSATDLDDWISRGGLLWQVHGEEGSFVVVRLVSYVKEDSCFGVSFDCKGGRKFRIIANETARNPKELGQFFQERGAELNLPDKASIGSLFRDAPCHLVLPDI